MSRLPEAVKGWKLYKRSRGVAIYQDPENPSHFRALIDPQESLRPIADVHTEWTHSTEPTHYEAVDDVTPDDDDTYISTDPDSDTLQADYYDFPNTAIPSDATINWVRICFRARSENSTYTGAIRSFMVTHNTDYIGDSHRPPASYTDYYQEYDTNPYTGEAWTIDEINSLYAGVQGASGHYCFGCFFYLFYPVRCTQVYLLIDYTVPALVVEVSDSGVVSDYFSKAVACVFKDSMLVSDVLRKEVSKSFRDYAVGEYITQTFTGRLVKVVETVIVAEYLRKRSEKVMVDVSIGSDYLRKATLKVFTDSSIVSDRIIKEAVRCFVDSVVSSDFVRREVSKSILDLSRVSDWIGKTLAKVLVDSEVTVDWISKAVSRSFIDPSKSYDYVSKASIKSLKDVGKGIDRISKSVGVSRLDTVLVSDWISKDLLKAVLDLGKVADWVSTIKAKMIIVRDVAFPDYSIAKDSVLVKRDSSLISDFYSKSVEKVAIDSGVVSERVSLGISKVLVDSGVVSDYFSKAISKDLIDVGKVADWISKDVLASLVESARVSDWVSRGTVYSLLDSISVADYIRREFSKSFRDYVVGEYVITKTATLHRSYADVVKSVDFVSKGLFIPLKDTVISSDYLVKEISRVVSDVARVLDWIGRRVAVTVSDLVKGLDYVSKSLAVNISDLAKAIDWIVVPTVKLIVVKDVVFPDFSTAKGVEKPFREVISVIDLKAIKDIAKRFVDYVIVRDQAIRTRIIEVFDRVIADFEVVKGISSVIKEVVKSVDVITKLRYTLTGIDVRRVYFHKFLGDIIEDTDEINRVDSSKNLLNMIKSLASKMGVADDPYISQDISKLEEIVGTMEYVKNGEYVYAKHVNVFVDYMTYAIDVVELLYDKWKSAKGTSLPEVDYLSLIHI